MVGNHQKIHELGTNRRTRNKRKYSEINQREDSKGSEGRMERKLEKKNSSGIYKRFKKEMKERNTVEVKSQWCGWEREQAA